MAYTRKTNSTASITQNTNYLTDISSLRQFVMSKRAKAFDEIMKYYNKKTSALINENGQYITSDAFNCFGFAMGLTPLEYPQLSKEFLQLTSEDENDNSLPLDNFLQIVSDLGLDIQEVDPKNVIPPTNDYEWNIAFYMSPYDFHFTRQLQNGRWAGKHGWCGYYEMYETLPKTIYHSLHDYTLVKVFKVSVKQNEK